MPRKTKSTVVAVPETTEVVSAEPIATISPKDLQIQISQESEKRKLITQFIAEHLKKGVDYGAIHVTKNCQNKYNCSNKYHFSKDVLFKPGAEKFCSLFKMRAEFVKDTETWDMVGAQAGMICYICRLYSSNGTLTGEGRGAASVSEKGNANTAIKIAEKRAKLDAVLSTGALSDFFTQDLEDMQPEADLSLEVPTLEYDVEEKPDVSEKTKLAHLLKLLNVKLNDPQLQEKVKTFTSLDFIPTNYPDIITRLELIVKENKENK